MIIDENLVFVALITIFAVFIINKQPYLIGIISLIIVVYVVYKGRFTNPKEFFSFIKNKAIEAFEPCSSSNMTYCGTNASNSDLTFLPDIMRASVPNNAINNMNTVSLKPEDYLIDRRLKLEGAISLDKMISVVPPLIDYKLYLEQLIKFVLSIETDDTIQNLAKRLSPSCCNIL